MLSAGDRLGRFEIVGPLGAGGMGEVYRARDPQLQRDVAVKVLPAEFSGDPVRRRRFEHEARAAGGLNHPNILAVYDVGLERDSLFIVTEVLEGETLSARMDGRALPPRKAAEYALQIASGLAAAHDRGVIHRDIKPGNLFVTTDGLVKILDFGLAKFVGPDASGDTDTVTLDDAERKPIIGSVSYMSPEQVRGQRLDHRTDIFSFGVVLYEMLAGFAPFRRSTSGDTLSAILHDEPAAIPGLALTAPLQRIARHCLEKKTHERFQNIRDVVFDLEAVQHDTSASGTAAPAVRRPRRALFTAGAIAAGLMGAMGLGWFAALQWQRAPAASLHRVRPMTSVVGLEEFPALSPDGKMLAFTASEGQRRQIYVRFLAERSTSPLRITHDDADHQQPRWSTESSIVYFSPAAPGEVQGAIYRIPALGGPPQRVMASIGGGDVSADGRLACFRLDQDRIQLVTATLDGSDVQVVATLNAQHYHYPRWSPDSRMIAFQAGDGFRSDVYAVPATRGAAVRRLTHDGHVVKGLTWRPDGRGVVYASARGSSFSYLPPLTLWEVMLDGAARQVTTSEASYEHPDLQRNGQLAVTRLQMRHEIWEYPFAAVATTVDAGRRLTWQTGQVATPSVSPDGNRIAYLSDTGGHANVWIASKDGSPRQITFEDDPGVSIGVPAWSPDGQWIVYLSSRDNGGLQFGAWLVKPDGSENHRLLTFALSPTWSEDSQWLYYVERSNTKIKRIRVTGGNPEEVRPELARNVIGLDRSTIYYLVDRALTDGRQQFEIHAAPLGAGPARSIKTIAASQLPPWQVLNPALSPDGEWMALPLTDGFTTNIWAISTRDGTMMKRVTDFGERAIFITRRLAWTRDGRAIVAAIGEGDADIWLLDGLFQGRN